MKPPGKQHTRPEAERRRIVARWLESDESAREVAAAEGISVPTLKRWRGQLQEGE